MKEKEFLLYIIRALVDEPDAVEINVVEGEKSTIFELNAAIAKSGKRISLDILG